MKPKLIRNYFFICDTVIRDSQSGAFSFINVRRNIISESFPCHSGGFFVAAGFQLAGRDTDLPRQLLVQLKIISPENKIILDMKQPVPLEHYKGEYHGFDFVFKLGRLNCDVPGHYRLLLMDFANEVVLGESDFELAFPPRPKLPKRTNEEIEQLLAQPDVIKKVDSSVRCPKCKHEKTFSVSLEKDIIRQMEQEILFPEDLIYTCEQCGEWRIHLGRMMVFMYKKLGTPSTGTQQ